MSLIGLPTETGIAVLVMVIAPILSYLLYRIDAQRGDGRVTVFGKGE